MDEISIKKCFYHHQIQVQIFFFEQEFYPSSFNLFFSSHSFSDAPVCISSSVTIVGASIDESVTIACRISADPPKVSFEWTFSNSGERYEVPSGHYTTIQQNLNADTDHIYLDADENGTNGNGTLTLFFFCSSIFFCEVIFLLFFCFKVFIICTFPYFSQFLIII